MLRFATAGIDGSGYATSVTPDSQTAVGRGYTKRERNFGNERRPTSVFCCQTHTINRRISASHLRLALTSVCFLSSRHICVLRLPRSVFSAVGLLPSTYENDGTIVAGDGGEEPQWSDG